MSGKSNIYRQAAAEALADVDALNLKGEDRAVVLAAVLASRLPSTTVDSGDSSTGESETPVEKKAKEPVSEGDIIGLLASAFGLDRDSIEQVYAVEDGEPILVVAAKKLPTNKSAATKQIAQLVAAARQVAKVEEWTGVGTIRPVVTHYGRIDPANFATSLLQMDSVAVIKGKGMSREFKITKPGIEATSDLLRSLVGQRDE